MPVREVTHIATPDGKALCNKARTIQTNHNRGLSTCEVCCQLDFSAEDGLPWLEDDYPSMDSFADAIETGLRAARAWQRQTTPFEQILAQMMRKR